MDRRQTDRILLRARLRLRGQVQHPTATTTVEIVCAGEELDHRAMLVDFGDIKDAVKSFIDENWDHRMLLRKDDPLAPEYEKRGEPVFLFDENPTAETFARFLYHHAREKGLPVSEVRFWETPTSYAAYRE